MSDKINIIFVCLGNICRSPLADGLMHHIVQEKGLSDYFNIDSAGTYAGHAGERADSRMRQTANSHGVELLSRARQFTTEDFDIFNHIVVMDDSNYQNVIRLAKSDEEKEKVFKLRSYDNNKSNSDVDDPYYGGIEGFENCYQVVLESVNNLLENLINNYNLPQLNK
ncbi:low molecular weight protein-tyrosine-phosphatase [Flammeovirga sp. SubArs3]|uniref:low molecular weight protein-tyrosine-phosphatase n=1 Tax=Flammeovirga sp. SubArs3 TaxID=2995316 RepID=UPI00248D184F|nr:low molecular weight protein-tyrosine-phosphatase [Flammeovirga sp. SubArs3]